MTTVGVLRERTPGERRVALVPSTVTTLRAAGLEVVVETGAGSAAWWSDEDYRDCGAVIATAGDVTAAADILVCVRAPDPALALRPAQMLIGLLDPLGDPGAVRRWAEAGVTAISLDLVPRTLSRAQSADALTSQAAIAGYKAALLAATTFGGYFPMLMTATGTIRPATVLVVGAGVAGLQALGTARRLGAVVTGYDVRPDSRAEIESVGARFLDLAAVAGSAAGTGGYARELSAAERAAQQQALGARLPDFDIVITTARVPGRTPPVVITRDALAAMRPGSVIVDLASGRTGGNVDGSMPDTTVVLGRGVTVIGAGDLPSTVPVAASTAYARNVTALLTGMLHDGLAVIDLSDELTAAVVVTHRGAVVSPVVAALGDTTLMAGGVR